MKVSQYFIVFEYAEHRMSDRVEISKKQYDQQLRFLRTQCCNTNGDVHPVEAVIPYARYYDNFVEIYHIFASCSAFTILVHRYNYIVDLNSKKG